MYLYMADWTARVVGYCHLRLKAYDVSLGHVPAKELVGGDRSTKEPFWHGASEQMMIHLYTFQMKSFPEEFFWYVDTLDLISFGRWMGRADVILESCCVIERKLLQDAAENGARPE